ncbi:MAG: HAD-IA family hydrolase [Spirochaetaceae bacterium]|nr:HAD-IA family hydrolase [Spirochaetaceae bacterium]
MALRALIFDFDGLIVDTETPWFALVRDAYRRHGCELPAEVWRQFVGTHRHPLEHLQQVVGPDFDMAAERAALIAGDTRDGLPPCAGVEQLVAAAGGAGLALGVASSSSRERVEGQLRRIGLRDAFDAVRCRGENLRSKPAPDIYLAALEDLAISASQAVVFEDSPIGTQAAKAAGIYTVAVPNDVTRGWPFDHADRVIDSLAGVTVPQVRCWLPGA